MTDTNSGRPAGAEHIPYFGRYIRLVPEGDILATLARQIGETTAFLGTLTTERARWRPAPGEWSGLEIVGHLADTERILAYRALRIARADPVLWEDIEFEPYVTNAGFDARSLPDLVEEFAAVRAATVALLRGLGEAAWDRRMPEEWTLRSVRAVSWVLAGHELHHLADLRNLPLD